MFKDVMLKTDEDTNDCLVVMGKVKRYCIGEMM